MASKTAILKKARKPAAVKAAAKPVAKVVAKKATSKVGPKVVAKVASKTVSKTAPKRAAKTRSARRAAAVRGDAAPKASATLEETITNVQASVQAVASGTVAAVATEEGIGYTDVAIASLCQSYAHTLSLAFHDIVLNQQRRSALGQAALARAIEQVQAAEPKDFEEKLGQLRKGLDVLGVSGTNDMEDFTAMSQQFVAAANQLVAVREKIAD